MNEGELEEVVPKYQNIVARRRVRTVKSAKPRVFSRSAPELEFEHINARGAWAIGAKLLYSPQLPTAQPLALQKRQPRRTD